MSHKAISIGLLILFVVALYVLLIKGVTPFVQEVATSDLFLEESDDPAEKFTSVKNEKTQAALAHCGQHLQENFDLAPSDRIEDKEYTAWALGNYMYVIKSFVYIEPTDPNQTSKLFACRIQYNGGDEFDIANWEISQFTYTED